MFDGVEAITSPVVDTIDWLTNWLIDWLVHRCCVDTLNTMTFWGRHPRCSGEPTSTGPSGGRVHRQTERERDNSNPSLTFTDCNQNAKSRCRLWSSSCSGRSNGCPTSRWFAAVAEFTRLSGEIYTHIATIGTVVWSVRNNQYSLHPANAERSSVTSALNQLQQQQPTADEAEFERRCALQLHRVTLRYVTPSNGGSWWSSAGNDNQWTFSYEYDQCDDDCLSLAQWDNGFLMYGRYSRRYYFSCRSCSDGSFNSSLVVDSWNSRQFSNPKEMADWEGVVQYSSFLLMI